MREERKCVNLTVVEGKITDIKGITDKNGKWIFTNNDPQIYVMFDYPVSYIRITCCLGKGDFETGIATIYFRENGNEIYKEENSFSFEIKTEGEIIREIEFQKPIKEIRFDPIAFSGKCEVKNIMLEKLEHSEIIDVFLSRLIWQEPKERKIIVITHDMSLSGAPILAFYIAEAFKKRNYNVVVLTLKTGEGFLKKRYESSGIPVINLERVENNGFAFMSLHERHKGKGNALKNIEFIERLLTILRKQGYSAVIANTIVSGKYVGILKDFNFKIVSLIHEMKTTIVRYGFYEFGEIISNNADYIVFPNEIVKNDFKQLYSKIEGKCLVRAQGVYLSTVNDISENINLQNYGIPKDAFIIMSSGTCELRKGVDLFINAALIMGSELAGRKNHFIWTGEFAEPELKCWLEDQIVRSGLEENVHFIPFIKEAAEYKKLLEMADVFWAMSREDPFPSTVLEAMKYRIPVIGFKGTGGVQVMLSENRGILIERFNLATVAESTKKVLMNKEAYALMKDSAQLYVDGLDFNSYIDFLVDCTQKEYCITPSLDLSIWNKKTHYQDLQLPEKTLKEKAKILNNARRRAMIGRKYKHNVVVLLDTAKGSDNVGDEIIMDYCSKVCRYVLKGREFYNIPTHIYDKKSENLESYFKILCGTNLIYKEMETSKQWALPNNLSSYRNICLLGVGMQQLGIEKPMSDYSRRLLHFMLSSKCIHSVRDEQTKLVLNKNGFKNVVNTGCPTMWGLTKEHCKKIPHDKSKIVITTVTDYMKDNVNDAFLLTTLKNNYESVYIWIQGQTDYEYLKELIDVREYNIIPPSLDKLDELFEMENVDYIGTRLHAGIRSLNYKHRTLIINVDNRAKSIAADTNLPILERSVLVDKLEEMLYSKIETDIKLPVHAIEVWKKQFVF